MSDFRPTMFANFINRRSGSIIKEVPIMNRVTVNKDIRQLCDSFDFDISFRFSDKVDLHSHDFVEFYFLIDGNPFQISCGFLEDFTKETSPTSHTFKANGRDFLGQFFNIPFLKAKSFDQTTLMVFLQSLISQSYVNADETKMMYLHEYLKFKGIKRQIINMGAFAGPLLVPELSDAKVAPIMQQLADEVYNIIYQNRLGQVVVWGRDQLSAMDTGLTIYDSTDLNTSKFTLRENFSKVFSEVKIFYCGGENNIDYKSTPSKAFFNSDLKSRQIFQPEIRTFQTGTLVTTAGQVDYVEKKDALAKSILRKSNQNLTQVVIQTNKPFYLTTNNQKIPYEVNQLWKISSPSNNLNESMRLAGIGYSQDSSNLDVELMFIPKDSLV